MGKLGCWKPSGGGQGRFKTHRHVCIYVYAYVRTCNGNRSCLRRQGGHNGKPYSNAASTGWPGRHRLSLAKRIEKFTK